MCGIAGIYWFDSGREVDPGVLDSMTDVLAHRGPDGRGIRIEGPLGLGHRRLAIIDLSPNAAQPIGNEDGTVWVICNGEIYNFQDLRDELVGKGHKFRSRCDSEVLVHLYEEMGDRLVDRLRGMFAFAIWDPRRRRLLLARDRFGQKPLYYRLTAEGVHFASEAKGILQDPAIPRVPDREALDAYLTYGYVPSPLSAFVGIRKLPPAHVLSIEADGRSDLRRYWRLRLGPKAAVAPRKLRVNARNRVLELLDEATRLRMISDVPLGALLSGGLDSSAVVASMCAQTGAGEGVPQTFTIGFQDQGFDESRYAAEVARHLGTEHHRLALTPGSFSDLETIAWHHGEPFADSSCLATFAVARMAREHVKVALTGDGGDELFCGYRRYAAMQLEQWLRGSAAPFASALRSPRMTGLLRRARRKSLSKDLVHSRRHRNGTLSDVYFSHIEVVSPELKRSLYDDTFFEHINPDAARLPLLRALEASSGGDFAERCTYMDASTYLPDDILVKVDVASMAHGLECRAPLLDHVLAEFVAGLPFRLKMSRLRRKLVLKNAVRGRLPGWVLARRKRGFKIPLEAWFKGSEAEVLHENLLSSRAVGRGYFRSTAVRTLVEEHVRGSANHQAVLFSLLMLEIWHRQWIDPTRTEQLDSPARQQPTRPAISGPLR